MSEFYKVSEEFKKFLLSDAEIKDDEINPANKVVEFGGKPYKIGWGGLAKNDKEAIAGVSGWLDSLPMNFGMMELEPRKANMPKKG